MRAHRTWWLVILLGGAALAAGLAARAGLAPAEVPAHFTEVGRPAHISPDYSGTVIPPNIAPLDFRVDEPGAGYVVSLRSAQGPAANLASRTGRFVIPMTAWKRLLALNAGAELVTDVYVRRRDGSWDRFQPVSNAVAREPIDPYLVYRLLNSVDNLYVTMGICQRNLEGYDESVILDNASFDGGCMNCHTFLNNSPDKMLIQVRRGRVDYGRAMVLVDHGVVHKVDAQTPASPSAPTYMSWHPSGRLAAFSMNKVRQFFHTARAEVRDVCDLDSDMAVYLADSAAVVTTAAISRPDRLETYPTWSPDGLYLYYCSAPVPWADRDKAPPEHYDQVRYDLMRIRVDADARAWGHAETVLSARETGKSITLPRISPDGRWLLFCMSDYGCFPIHQVSADLYMMDLGTRQYRRLAINSNRQDTWHCWSSNGRWIVFSSKRADGLLARPYIAYVDETGEVHKPFVLPQRDPDFYDGFLKTYNLPELIQRPVPVRGEQIARVIRSPVWVKSELAVTSASPRVGAPSPAASSGVDQPWHARP